MDLKTFAHNRLKSYNPKTGLLERVKPFASQEWIFDSIESNERTQIIHSRQVGVTTALALYCAYFLSGTHAITDPKLFVFASSGHILKDFIALVDRFRDIKPSVYEMETGYRRENDRTIWFKVSSIGNLRGVHSDCIILHPELCAGIEDWLLRVTADKETAPKLIVDGPLPSSVDIYFNIVKIHWTDSELWSPARYNLVMHYLHDNREMDDLSPYYRGEYQPKSKSGSLDKTIQVRVDQRIYKELAIMAANTDKTLSEYVREILIRTVGN